MANGLDDAEADDEGDDERRRSDPEFLRADQRHDGAFDADHAADKGVDQNEQRELPPVGAQPEATTLGLNRLVIGRSFGCGHHAGIDRADLRRLRRRRRNIGEHGAHEGRLVLDPERLVVALLEADGGRRFAAQGCVRRPSRNRLRATLPDNRAGP